MISRPYLIVIFLVGAAVIGFFLVWPEYKEIVKVQSEIEDAHLRIQRGEEYYSNLEDLRDKLKKYQDQLGVISSALPKKFYLPHLYDFFPKICSQNGLVLQDIGITTTPSKEKEIQEIHVSLGVLGTYPSFKNFLSSLEKSVRFFGIEKISFSSSEEAPFSFSLTIKTHSY